MGLLRLEGGGVQGKVEEIKTSRYGETQKSRDAIKKNQRGCIGVVDRASRLIENIKHCRIVCLPQCRSEVVQK